MGEAKRRRQEVEMARERDDGIEGRGGDVVGEEGGGEEDSREVRWEVRKRIRGARRGMLDERGGARLIMVGRGWYRVSSLYSSERCISLKRGVFSEELSFSRSAIM